MIQIQNTTYGLIAIISFEVIRIVDTINQKLTAENVIFGFKRTSKRVNPSKSPLRKFDPKTILSLLRY